MTYLSLLHHQVKIVVQLFFVKLSDWAGLKEGWLMSDRGEKIGGEEMVNSIFVIKN